MATYYWVGGSGTWNNANTANWSASTGGAAGAGPPLSIDTVVFDASSGSGTVSVASTAAAAAVTLNAANITLQLLGNCVLNANFNFSAGGLDLAGYSITLNYMVTATAGAKTLAFGATGAVVLIANNNQIWNTPAANNITISGSAPVVNCTYSGGTGTRTIITSAAAPYISFNISAGTDTITLGSGTYYQNINFTGFSGTWNSVVTVFLYGDLTLSAGMTLNASTNVIQFLSTTTTQKLTSAGKTIDIPLQKIGVGGTLELQDNLTMGSTKTFTLTSGTLDLKGSTLSASTFATSNSNTRALAFGTNGGLTLSGSGTAFNAATGTNLTTSGTGTISLTSGSAKTFAGGGRSYPTLNQGGSGALTVSGSNTFINITNTVQPATISLTAGTTTTVTDFDVSGTAGNLITLNSTSAGSRATLTDSGGINSVSYVDIKDIAATGYGEWQAYTTNGNVDSGNNVGWVFTEPSPLIASEYQISLKSFTERRSF